MIEKGHSTSGPFRFFKSVSGSFDSVFRGPKGWMSGFGGDEFLGAGGGMVLVSLGVTRFCVVRATLDCQTWVNLCSAIFQLTSWG